ncbi:MAG: sugar ABC transporter ATP-binding protein [Polynucleobacter sp.]|nr:sugar ABC transporter ATP-binding protein [Polynucleobacter sp.]
MKPILELKNISKNFPGIKALDQVSFSIIPGEVHMLLGENGAGKSTLMKILCGAYQADAGELYYQGEQIEIHSPSDAKKFGIAVIFQEFSLVPYLNIAQNIFLGREFSGWIPGTIDHSKMHAEARRLLDSLSVEYDTHTLVHTLGVAQQQMVEIAKALSQNAKILVMDEPTAALSDRETTLLFEMIHKLKAQGVAIVYISHRMAEVFSMGDRISVLRDGQYVGSADPQKTTPDELVQMMVGRTVDMVYQKNFISKPGAIALRVENLCSSNGIRDIHLEVRCGEIVGLAGLVGSGRTEVARAIFGADPVTSGRVEIFGKDRVGEPFHSVELGLSLIPENRKSEGLALIRTVEENIVLAGLKKLFPSNWIRLSRSEQVANDLITRLRIATPSGKRPALVLSGGNQQKIVIGKWLSTESKIFIFDEPTRGIDVGSKSEIFSLIYKLVQDGAAVLLISSELSEIVRVCDRVYVMREGTISGELSGDLINEANVLKLGMADV